MYYIYLFYTYVHTYVCMYVRIIPCTMCTSVLAKFVAELEPKSQKGLSPWNHSPFACPSLLSVPPSMGYPSARATWLPVCTLEHTARWALCFLSSPCVCCFWRLLYCIIQTYLYLRALWRHCSTLWWGFKYKTQICVTVCVCVCVRKSLGVC